MASVCWQSVLPSEVIVADDGSNIETTNLIAKYGKTMKVPLVHPISLIVVFVWQDRGGILAISKV